MGRRYKLLLNDVLYMAPARIMENDNTIRKRAAWRLLCPVFYSKWRMKVIQSNFLYLNGIDYTYEPI